MVNMIATNGKLQCCGSLGFLVLLGEQSCELISRCLLERGVSVFAKCEGYCVARGAAIV